MWDCCRLRSLGRTAAQKGLASGWADAASNSLGELGDNMVHASLELARELQAALFRPGALTSSLGTHAPTSGSICTRRGGAVLCREWCMAHGKGWLLACS